MSLKTKLIILLIAFTLIPVVLSGAVVFYRARNILETVRIAQLNSIADLKKDKIETFFFERQGDIRSAQNFLNIKRNLPVLSAPAQQRSRASYGKALKELDGQLIPFQTAFGYLDVMLTDHEGRIVYVSNDARKPEYLGKFLPDKRTFEEGKKDVYFTDVFIGNDPGAAFKMFCLAPLKGLSGEFIGEIVIEIDMGPIYRFIQDSTGLGTTGEALIVRREGNEVLFLSPLVAVPGAALKKRVAFEEKAAVPAQKAAGGETGSGLTYDYGGTEVLAAWRYIPSLRWGLVTKINAAEAFAPVAQLKIIIITVGIFMVLAGVLAAVAISRSVTRPVQALQQGAEAIAAGDLRQRVGTKAKDEIGRLSRAFDSMTEALARDMAHREKTEEEIRKLNEDLKHHVRQLEESNKELEAFSYSVSHDLRSPLRSIVGFSQALLEDHAAKLDTEGRDFLGRIVSATTRMSRLIDDLLKMSRVSRHAMTREQVDLSALARNIAGRLRDSQPERDAEFIVADGLTVYGDERLLGVMLENLLANAWKFSENTPRTVLEFGVISVDGAPAYFVRDNGAGFDMAYVDKLFNPFQRLHRDSEFSGTGIGLATVKRIINRHGGRVWIEGKVGTGTTVYFTL
jgi:signal transduction histidine kinase